MLAMKSNRNTNTSSVPVTDKKKPSLTPRELIKHHIENPDDPITDEDIQNLNLEYEISGGITSYNSYREEKSE
jgi:hypothetical protein